MKALIHAAAMIVVATISHSASAQQPESQKDVQPSQAAPISPAEVEKQYAKMQEHMLKMQEQMEKIRQAKDPQERQRLLQEHWTTMRGAMSVMHGAEHGGQMDCCPGGGRMMGGPMPWRDYSQLTPEQLKQRQYMMDRWMPMHQMMMDQMMQHQHWVMQQPAPPKQQ
jgi:hypothetical protein